MPKTHIGTAGVSLQSQYAPLNMGKMTATEVRPTSWAGRVPLLKPGRYADGLPLHDVQYLCCKLVLRPNHFRSRKSLFDFAKVLIDPCKKHGVTFATGRFKDDPIQIREVLFIDTSDRRLYNNAFILRRRLDYVDGFAVGDPEIVFKFRHPDLQKAAEMDVRPKLVDGYQGSAHETEKIVR
jgi:hypothetical protein